MNFSITTSILAGLVFGLLFGVLGDIVVASAVVHFFETPRRSRTVSGLIKDLRLVPAMWAGVGASGWLGGTLVQTLDRNSLVFWYLVGLAVAVVPALVVMVFGPIALRLGNLLRP